MVECLRGAFVVMCALCVGVAVAVVPDEIHSGFFSVADDFIKNTKNMELMDGVTFVKTSEGTSRSAANGNIGVLLLDRLNSFLNTHVVRVDLAEPEVEGRGKRKKMKGGKKNYIIPLLLGIKGKMMLLSAAVANLIAAIAGKAIIVSKIALILGIMLFLKKLVTNPPKEVKHEHIKHKKIIVQTEEPEMHNSNDAWNQGHRSDFDLNTYAHEMAYMQQKPIL